MPGGRVALVGAGPGDPRLLTLRGAELLATAEVVVHDRLVHPAVLDHAPRARFVDVGKRPGEPGPTQEEINAILVEEAGAGRIVVRLKGGDPFVFGRGGEEVEALRAAGIAHEVVPGITSAIAAPAYAGIPMTHRGLSSWAAIATGHEDPSKDGSDLDWEALARAGTAVMMMGIRRLGEIASKLEAAGRDPRTPVAVIQRGTWPSQRVLRSTLGAVAEDVAAAGIGPPAVLVVGPVAALADAGSWFERRPLAGRRVFVTRTRAQASRLVARLWELGAEPLSYPAIRITPPDDAEALPLALGRLEACAYDWVVLTSANAVDAVEASLASSGRDARIFAGARIAVIGPSTADRLRAIGLRPDLVPDAFTSSALVSAFPTAPDVGGAVLIPRAQEAPDELPDGLHEKGWRPEVVAAYRTMPDTASVDGGRTILAEGVDAVLFTSGSTVRSFLELWGTPPEGALVCCIGPVTATVARDAGLRVDVEAEEHTIEGLLAALVDAVGGS